MEKDIQRINIYTAIEQMKRLSQELQSDAGLHLEFASEDKNNGVALFQSMTNGNYVPFGSYNYVGSTMDVAITGVISGMYIKVQSISQPTLAKILVSE